jgi:nicotinate-nucleotide--dimethylbenzimidazole phosphoribosyltransferase
VTGTATDGAGADSRAVDPPVDLAAAAADITDVDEHAAREVHDRLDASAGRLRDLAAWLAATGRVPTRPRCLLAGSAPATATALAASLDVGIRSIPADGSIEDALAVGRSIADDEVETGTDLVVLGCGVLPAGPAGGAGDTATALVAVLAGLEPVAVLPRGAGAVDTATWIRRAEWLRRVRRDLFDARRRPDVLLDRLADPALAALLGVLTRLTARRTPVVLAGLPVLAVAMLLRSVMPDAVGWWQLADAADAADPAAARAARDLDLVPLLPLGVTAPGAPAGLLTVPVLRAAAALLGTDGS